MADAVVAAQGGGLHGGACGAHHGEGCVVGQGDCVRIRLFATVEVEKAVVGRLAFACSC